MDLLIGVITVIVTINYSLFEMKKTKPWTVMVLLLTMFAGVSAWNICTNGIAQYLTGVALPVGIVFFIVFAVDRIGSKFIKDEDGEKKEEKIEEGDEVKQ